MGFLALVLVLGQDPAQILTEAGRALRAAPREADVTLSRTQVLTWQSHVADGTVLIDPERNASRVDADVKLLRGKDSRRVTLVREGDAFTFVDHEERAFYRGDRPVLAGLDSRLAYDLALLGAIDPMTLAEEGSPTLGDPTTLAGVACDKVVATLEDGPTTHTWYIARTDRLPRILESDRDLGRGDRLKKRLTVREFRPGKPLPTFVVPEGYEQREPLTWADPELAARITVEARYTELAGSIDALRAPFNAERARVRAIGVFAPT